MREELLSNKMQNSIFPIFMLIDFVSLVIIRIEPDHIAVNDKNQIISLNFSISSSEQTLENDLKFVIKCGQSCEQHYEPDFRNQWYSYKQLNYSYRKWKSLVKASNDSFKVEFLVYFNLSYSDPISAQIILAKGMSH